MQLIIWVGLGLSWLVSVSGLAAVTSLLSLRMKNFDFSWLALSLMFTGFAAASGYDLVIRNGRVMDPESNFDAVAHVGINDGKIVAITKNSISGKREIDAKGLVVAPGFIDLHAHGQNRESRILQANDGVTTALDLETGVYPVATWYADQAGTSPIHYGATVSHIGARVKVKGGVDLGHMATASQSVQAQVGNSWKNEKATKDEIENLKFYLSQGIGEGALGIGYGIEYTPGATHEEIYETFKVAAKFGLPAYVHPRGSSSFGDKKAFGPLQEVIADAAATGASLHVVHINSNCKEQAPLCLEMVRGAKRQGVDITTESYPWTASSTRLESALFDAEDWEAANGLKYSDIMWTKTGERLNSETFKEYRKLGGWVDSWGHAKQVYILCGRDSAAAMAP